MASGTPPGSVGPERHDHGDDGQQGRRGDGQAAPLLRLVDGVLGHQGAQGRGQQRDDDDAGEGDGAHGVPGPEQRGDQQQHAEHRRRGRPEHPDDRRHQHHEQGHQARSRQEVGALPLDDVLPALADDERRREDAEADRVEQHDQRGQDRYGGQPGELAAVRAPGDEEGQQEQVPVGDADEPEAVAQRPDPRERDQPPPRAQVLLGAQPGGDDHGDQQVADHLRPRRERVLPGRDEEHGRHDGRQRPGVLAGDQEDDADEHDDRRREQPDEDGQPEPALEQRDDDLGQRLRRHPVRRRERRPVLGRGQGAFVEEVLTEGEVEPGVRVVQRRRRAGRRPGDAEAEQRVRHRPDHPVGERGRRHPERLSDIPSARRAIGHQGRILSLSVLSGGARWRSSPGP